MSALVFQAGRIRDQLEDLTRRRSELFQQRLLMKSDQRAGHDARIAEIDARSAALEKQLFATEDAMSQARGGPDIVRGGPVIAGGTIQDASGLTRRDVQRAVADGMRQGAFGTVFSMFAIYMVYRGVRRFIVRRKPTPAFPDHSMQLAQLQQSVDVIALEVERISEGQRYVAKVLGDKAALGAGSAQPVSVPRGEAVGAREQRR